jgi:DnaJ-class molecular chaperone
MGDINCPKCKGTGFVKEKDGSVHTCFDCLLNGSMDQHDEHVKDSGIRV